MGLHQVEQICLAVLAIEGLIKMSVTDHAAMPVPVNIPCFLYVH